MNNIRFYFGFCNRCKIIFYLLIINWSAFGQAIPLNPGFLRDYIRRQQILGHSDSLVSFSILPLNFNKHPELQKKFISEENSKSFRSSDSIHFQFYPVVSENLWNSSHPYGDNLGSMFSGRGFQTRFTSGVFAQKGSFNIQFMPELIFAENKFFEQFAPDLHPYFWYYMSAWWNKIDLPTRFGTKHLFKFFPGQSKLAFQSKKFEYALGTQNIWWGPAKRNSVLMGNSSPGFPHISFKTKDPVLSKIGSFETMVFSGLLSDSNQKPPSEFFIKNIYDKVFVPRNKENRYFTGFNLVYQPRSLNGLFFGLSRTSQLYFSQISSAWNLTPFFNGVAEDNVNADLVRTQNLALTSLYFRMLMKKSNAEFYGEFGSQNSKQGALVWLSPFSSGQKMFTVGVNKILKIREDSGISLDFETSENGLRDRALIRNKSSFYTHNIIRQGYTHSGRMLGANIGPGANVQFAQATWFDGINSIGLFLERRVHNNDFYYFSYELPFPDSRKHWVDLSAGISANFDFKNIIVGLSLTAIKSFNYQWVIFMRPGIPFSDGRDVMNYHASLSIQWMLWKGVN